MMTERCSGAHIHRETLAEDNLWTTNVCCIQTSSIESNTRVFTVSHFIKSDVYFRMCLCFTVSEREAESVSAEDTDCKECEGNHYSHQ